LEHLIGVFQFFAMLHLKSLQRNRFSSGTISHLFHFCNPL
jgi:hypothetical protein